MALDWDNWKANTEGWLGRFGEVFVDPEVCPRRRSACEDCPVFMGHKAEGPCFSGENIRFCCGDKLGAQS